MPSLVKAQFDLPASTLTDVYQAEANRQVPVTIYLCNRRNSNTTFRLAIAPAAEADDLKHYLYYDATLPANNSLKESFNLIDGDMIRVQVGATDVSVNVLADQSLKLVT